MPSANRSPIRLLACLSLLALVSACERTPPPPEAPAASTAAPDVAASADTVAAPSAPMSQAFAADDARIGTEVGERVLGQGMSTTGKAGWLMYGPYVEWPAGNYQVELQGSVQAGHAGVVHVDVAQSKGNEVLASVELDAPALLAPASPDGIIVLPFALKQTSHDLEVRVRVADASKLSISGYVIRTVP